MIRPNCSTTESTAIRRPVGTKSLINTNAHSLSLVDRKYPVQKYQNSYRDSFKERQFTSTAPACEEEAKKVSITFVDTKTETSKTVQAEIGKHLLSVAHDNNLELEGACGGELACATCHLIFEKKIFDMLPEIEEEEVDMLDLAFEVTETSRLGCQILVREEFEGMTVTIPDDGF